MTTAVLAPWVDAMIEDSLAHRLRAGEHPDDVALTIMGCCWHDQNEVAVLRLKRRMSQLVPVPIRVTALTRHADAVIDDLIAELDSKPMPEPHWTIPARRPRPNFLIGDQPPPGRRSWLDRLLGTAAPP